MHAHFVNEVALQYPDMHTPAARCGHTTVVANNLHSTVKVASMTHGDVCNAAVLQLKLPSLPACCSVLRSHAAQRSSRRMWLHHDELLCTDAGAAILRALKTMARMLTLVSL